MRVWEQAPFHEGDELSRTQLDQILRESRYHATYARALDLLARREHSRFLLQQKLRQRDCEEQAIERALNDLAGAGYLDDRRFAESWTRSRLRAHPEGRLLLVGHLRERGVSRDTAEEAVDAVLRDGEQTLVEAARAVVTRLTRRRSLDEATITHKLYQRGFSRAVISEAMKTVEPVDIDYPAEFEE